MNAIESRFRDLVNRWRQKSGSLSSLSAIARVPEYQDIIGLGAQAVPMILREIKSDPDGAVHWSLALNAITGQNPVSEADMGNAQKTSRAWLNWADENGVLLHPPLAPLRPVQPPVQPPPNGKKKD